MQFEKDNKRKGCQTFDNLTTLCTLANLFDHLWRQIIANHNLTPHLTPLFVNCHHCELSISIIESSNIHNNNISSTKYMKTKCCSRIVNFVRIEKTVALQTLCGYLSWHTLLCMDLAKNRQDSQDPDEVILPFPRCNQHLEDTRQFAFHHWLRYGMTAFKMTFRNILQGRSSGRVSNYFCIFLVNDIIQPY